MGLISAMLLPANTVKGFDAIKGKQNYDIVYDNEKNVLCWYYQMSGLGKQMIDTYYKHNGKDVSNVDVKTKHLRNKSEEVQSMMNKKICLLDEKLVTYEVVVKLAGTQTIIGYTKDKLKPNLNKFKTK